MNYASEARDILKEGCSKEFRLEFDNMIEGLLFPSIRTHGYNDISIVATHVEKYFTCKINLRNKIKRELEKEGFSVDYICSDHPCSTPYYRISF